MHVSRIKRFHCFAPVHGENDISNKRFLADTMITRWRSLTERGSIPLISIVQRFPPFSKRINSSFVVYIYYIDNFNFYAFPRAKIFIIDTRKSTSDQISVYSTT